MKTPIVKVFLLAFIFSLPITITAAAEEDATLWQPWEDKPINSIGDANTGSSVTLSEVVTTPAGSPALQITPSGTSEETKIAIPFTATDLRDLSTYGKIALEVYLPEANALNPNTFFLGIADVTGEFLWSGGVYSDNIDVQPGWNRLIYTLDPTMRLPIADYRYLLYLSFFHTDDGDKIPLSEPIYLGSIYLACHASAVTHSADSVYQSEVDMLLKLDDAAFLDAVAQQTFDYFWQEADPDTGLIKDRSTPGSPSSIAAVGFGLSAIPLAIDRGWLGFDRGYGRVLTTLHTFADGGVQGSHGFFYHFIDMQTGVRAYSSEVSSIDTALFIAGALTAGEYFKGTEVETLANRLYEAVEWDWMAAGGTTIKMGWSPDDGFITASWDHFDESMILYALALGSPTHRIPAAVWDEWSRPVNLADGGYIYLINDPLFVYQYPLVWLDLHHREDAYANYWNNTVKACERNRRFALTNAERFATFRDGVWGVSASDGPNGYRAYGASLSITDGTIAPYASVACLPFTPDESLATMRVLLTKYGAKVWRDYGFVSAINEDQSWYSSEHIGIDEGDLLLMIANYQDGFVWNHFMQNPNIGHALDAMGFVSSVGDYAVTLSYLSRASNR